MGFQMKYAITPDYITKGTARRSGRTMGEVIFAVAHDTGNKNSTARNNVNYYKRSCNDEKASAHLFVDDREILECVPALTGPPEKAWHVMYQMPKDNELYGVDANDAAVGVELCYGDNINADEAYKRYVWVLAYICYLFDLDPSGAITAHMILDPKNRTDPENALSESGRSYDQLLVDIVTEYNACKANGGNVMAETWMQDIMNKAKAAGLISSDHNPTDVAQKWFVLAVMLNFMDMMKGAK